MRYHLMRQDEGGSRVLIRCYADPMAAECERLRLNQEAQVQAYEIDSVEEECEHKKREYRA